MYRLLYLSGCYLHLLNIKEQETNWSTEPPPPSGNSRLGSYLPLEIPTEFPTTLHWVG